MMKWYILEPDLQIVQSVQSRFNISAVIAQVLTNRKIYSPESARHFFKSDLNNLLDPYLMKGMEKAVPRVLKNIREHKPVMVFGDYDVDGTTGAASLYIALKVFGADVVYYIPDRDKEGYGLSLKGIDQAGNDQIDLIITCDCGINAFKQVQYANSKSIDIIITDHHTPDFALPDAYAILNPNQKDCAYPFKGLCGGGVAFKLISAVGNELHIPRADYDEIIPLITLGTAADIVPICDENRIIVEHGLKMMPSLRRPGLKALLDLAGLKGNLSVGQLVFSIAPRINAAGRLGDANRAVECMVTMDEQKAKLLARELDVENKRRQMIQQNVVDEAIYKINAETDLQKEKALVLSHETWHPGVVGIVASKIKEKYNRPAVIIAMENGKGKGSARSIPGFDLYEALSECSDFLDGFGGHPMAAGLSIHAEQLPDFKNAFLEIANSKIDVAQLDPTLVLDAVLTLQDINPRFMEFLEKLGPFGPGNMRPKFALMNCTISGSPKVIGRSGEHIRFIVKQGHRSIQAVGFGLAEKYEMLIMGKPVDIACVVETNEWQGNTSIQLDVRDIKVSAIS